MGGKGVFVKELEGAADGPNRSGGAQYEDVPTELPGVWSSPPSRNARMCATADFASGRALGSAQGGARGTSSLRRQAQLLHSRPDCRWWEMRQRGYAAGESGARRLRRHRCLQGGPGGLGWRSHYRSAFHGCQFARRGAGGDRRSNTARRCHGLKNPCSSSIHSDTQMAVDGERAVLTGSKADACFPWACGRAFRIGNS